MNNVETNAVAISYNVKTDNNEKVTEAIQSEAASSKAAEREVMAYIVGKMMLPKKQWQTTTDADGVVTVKSGYDAGSAEASAIAIDVTKRILAAIDLLRESLGGNPSKAERKRITNLQAKYLGMVAQATGFKPLRVPNTQSFTLEKLEAKEPKKLGADGNAPSSTGLDPVEDKADKAAKTLATMSPEQVLASLAKVYASRQAFLSDCLRAANAQFPGEVPETPKTQDKKGPTNPAMAEALAKAGAA